MWPFSSKPKCAHDWKVQGETVSKPVSVEFTRLRAVSDFVHGLQDLQDMMLIQGVTRFLLTCSKCGAIETRVVLGVQKEEKPPP